MEYTNSNMILKIQKVRENAKIPLRATDGSAGYDLYVCIDNPITILPGESVVFPSGIAMSVPTGTAGLIYTRSGLGIKHGIHVTNGVGVIDSDYRGEVSIALHNLSDKAYTVNPDDRVAQLIITPYFVPQICECNNLDETLRGAGGFGSTGIK